MNGSFILFFEGGGSVQGLTFFQGTIYGDSTAGGLLSMTMALQSILSGEAFIDPVTLSVNYSLDSGIVGVGTASGDLNYDLPEFVADEAVSLLPSGIVLTDYLGRLTDAADYRLKHLMITRTPFTWYLFTDLPGIGTKVYAVDILMTPAGYDKVRIKVLKVAGPTGSVGDSLYLNLVDRTFTYQNLPPGEAFDRFLTEHVATLMSGIDADYRFQFENILYMTGDEGETPYNG